METVAEVLAALVDTTALVVAATVVVAVQSLVSKPSLTTFQICKHTNLQTRQN